MMKFIPVVKIETIHPIVIALLHVFFLISSPLNRCRIPSPSFETDGKKDTTELIRTPSQR